MRRCLILLASLVMSCSMAWGQDTATIVGTVADPTGAVIPGAKVTVSNPQKGYTRVLVADSAGLYRANALPLGDYVVTSEVSGFQKLVRSGIHLEVGQIQQVNMTMQVGQTTQEVTISGNLPKVQTETANISDVVTGTQIEKLDLNGRNFVALATLVPGAVPDNGFSASQVGVMGNNSISFNGNRFQYSNWEIDGGNNTDEGSASTFNTYPDLDSIGEFRITTNDYNASMGRHAGANIEVATKSGTQQFHGDAFEYVRNDAFDSNPFFVNRTIEPAGVSAPITPLKWNDYGYTLGGPVYIPGVYNTDKSKTFFFWSEEWRGYRQGTVINQGVPTTRMRNGDFSQCDPKSVNYSPSIGTCAVPTDPTTGQPFAGDIVPITTDGQALLNGLFPLPNSGLAGYVNAPTVPTNWRQEQIRVDENLSDKTSIFVRYTQDAWNQTTIPSLWAWASYDTTNTQFLGPGKSAVMHITHTFQPNLMNEFVMGYTVDHISLFPVAGVSSPAGSIDKPAGWSMGHFFPANASNPLLPAIAVCGGTTFCIGQDASNEPWFNSNPIITWKDNLAYIVGKQSIKTGFFLEKYRKNEQFGGDTQGLLQFYGGGTVTTGNALADMYLGRVQQYSEGTQTVNGVPVGGYAKGHWRMTDFEPYFEDDVKWTPHLTVNLGVRYYFFVPIHDVSTPQTVDSNFFPNLYNPKFAPQLDASGNIIPGTGVNFTQYGNGMFACGQSGIAAGCRAPFYHTISPRFGFAWDPTGHGTTSIRGGYGVYYDAGNGNEANPEGAEGNPPVSLDPSGYNLPNYQTIVPGAFGPTGFTSIPYYMGYPQVQQYSLSVQHSFTNNDILSVSYVGTQGRDLATGINWNQVPLGVGNMTVPVLANSNAYCGAGGVCNVQQDLINQKNPPIFFAPYQGWGGITSKQNGATSHYNSLQANFRHSTSKGLTFEASYTWAHAIDNSSTVYFSGSSAGGVDTSNMARWYGTSDFNRTQVLTMNFVYDLPFFTNSSNHYVRSALGGWELSGIGTMMTGEPIDFNCGVSGVSTGIGQGYRCNTLGTLAPNKTTVNDPTYGPSPGWYNPALVAQPTSAQLLSNGEPGMFGYMGRNILTGPGQNNWDIAMLKNFELPWLNGEHSTLQFRWETFNTFNWTEWQGVNSGCANTTPLGGACGGTLNGQLLGSVNSAWDPRLMQFALKFIF